MQGIEPDGLVKAIVCNDLYQVLLKAQDTEDWSETKKIFKWLQKNGIVDGVRCWGSHAIMLRYLDLTETLNTK
jgi:homoserine trans-succinylase